MVIMGSLSIRIIIIRIIMMITTIRIFINMTIVIFGEYYVFWWVLCFVS